MAGATKTAESKSKAGKGRDLVIVESPAKARTINKYLGKNYVVKSSVGHIRDLPKSGTSISSEERSARAKKAAKDAAALKKLPPKKREKIRAERKKQALVHRMGVDPENGWTARYEILPGKEKVLDELKSLAASAEHVYLATDLDREGEAIAWHLKECIGGDASRFRRVTFSEITKRAIAQAFEEPKKLNLDRVQAQQARRFLDRVVGYMVSPLLWQKVARGLSAGRVQSVATRLVVEREREIQAFVPEEFWEVHTTQCREGADEAFKAEVVKHKGEKFRPVNEEGAQQAVDTIQQARLEVVGRDDRPRKAKPRPPFITSTLQQTASVRLGFSVKKTMTLAQALYQQGLITYMRTDSTNLSAEAVSACRGYVSDVHGEQYLPDKAPSYASKEGAQEAHEAIRPSDVNLHPAAVSGLDDGHKKLYDLIWRRFVACQMKAAEFETTALTIAAEDYELRARGRVMRFDGWMKVLPPSSKSDSDVILPDLKVGDLLNLLSIDPSQHFTKPPPRFTEASLVKELEARGIGRPSTYAAVISTIQERGYVRMDARRLHAEKMGMIVTDRLIESFPELLSYDFTAGMEERLDSVAQGDAEWLGLLDDFYGDFKAKLEAASNDDGMRTNEPVPTDVDCEACGRKMVLRTARTGVFLSCTGYDLPKAERCTQTVNLVRGEESEEVQKAGEGEEREVVELREKRRCQKCSRAMDAYLVDETRRLHVCSNSPDCLGIYTETGEFKIKGYDGPTLDCDKCSAEMQLKSGRFGKYFGCTECSNTRKLLRNGEPAPPKADPIPMPELKCEKTDGYFILRDGAAGLFLASSNFPRSKETRNAYVKEIRPHGEALDPKYQFLLGAPDADPNGNPTLIRFSRKEKEQYVASEKEGKPTGWEMRYRDGAWAVTAEAKKTKKKKTSKKKAAKKKASKKKTKKKKTSKKKATKKKAS